PIANTQMYVVDANMNPVPAGVAGELLIGGRGLARGYLRRPQLDAEKFIDAAFLNQPWPDSCHSASYSGLQSDRRVYRTGDLVRWLPHGVLEFLGRIDTQVKIRGLRIELGEIEHALRAHPAVRDVVLEAKASPAQQLSLVAYVVLQDNATDAAPIASGDIHAILSAFLAPSLPAYMVPALYVCLPSLPLTPNGKIDRRALPEPDWQDGREQYVAPQRAIEQQLTQLWQDLLGLAQVGMQDNFFHLGGHSLLATRMMAAIEQQFAIKLPLKALFAAPTLASLIPQIEALLAKPASAEPPLLPVARDQALLPSYAQQRLWMLDQIDGGNSHYNMPAVLRLSGQLDIAAMSRSLRAIFARHESLRTCFVVADGGQLVQVIQPVPDFELIVTDLRQLPDQAREQQLQALMCADCDSSFDLQRDLMLRASLLQVADDETVLLVNIHHIASDGWSMAIFISEISQFYQAFSQGLTPQLPALPIQYADYAHWQRHYLQGAVLEQQLDYWSKQLAGIPAVHSLPLDFPRPASQTFSGDAVFSQLDSATTSALHALCRAHGATLFMGLHAAFSALLARYSNETDIVVGTSIANREQEQVAGLIGFFINSLILRSDLSGQPNFNQLLLQSRQMLLDAYAHQQVPSEQIIERLRPERNMAYSPLFQVMLILQNNRQAELSLPGLQVKLEPQGKLPSKFDLSLYVTENADGLALDWEFNPDLFLHSTISNMASQFAVLLQALLAQPEQNVFALPMLDASAQAQVLYGFNQSFTDFPRQTCIQALFEAQVAAQPDAIALEYEGQQRSYAELNRQANQLAHYLRNVLRSESGNESGNVQQVGPDTLVGICLPRSLNMIVAMLGILKAGGAYVPLDPNYPAARLEYMVQDAALRSVITESALLDKIAFNGAAALCLDLPQMQAQLAAQPTDNLAVHEIGLQPEHLSYVIYTSGSTGNPKGVMISHANLVNLALSVKQRYQLTPQDGFLQFATMNFDMSVEDIFSSLVSGNRLILRSDAWLASPAEFWQRCASANVTVLDLPTAFWHELAN
ncbi:MAG: hypothetical protein RL748_4493, partial [Pseudomonadota bacterium]